MAWPDEHVAMNNFVGSVWWLIVSLGVLVTFHEFGHYWVARRCGVKVLRFSVGFGNALWSRMGRDGTESMVAAIPLGGYVKMLDVREGDVAAGDLPYAFNRQPVGKRLDCAYSGYCGSYGCPTGAKGSSRAALLGRAVETGRCEVRPLSRARRVVTGADGRAEGVVYVDQRTGESHRVEAKVVVVACQAIETARLLLLSTGPKHPAGLGNRSGQVGRNLLFCPDGAGLGDFPFADLSSERAEELLCATGRL